MKVLVVGSGGREHALAWALAKEAEVFAAPGNPGIESVAECAAVAQTDAAGLIDLCISRSIGLVVFGSEAPLLAGAADALREAGVAVFGPGAAAARLEGDKAWAKQQMAAAGVPTARATAFSDPAPAIAEAERLAREGGVAVKASGPALGKGVVVTCDPAEARDAVESWMVRGELGESGRRVVVEERLVGREFSLLTLVSEAGIASLALAQDYKRVGEGDTGPNTGGMGSVCPLPWAQDGLVEEAEERLVRPILRVLAEGGFAYRGVLFTGGMLCEDGPRCLEYNVRFGDPETQSVVRLLGPGFADALASVASGGAPELAPPAPGTAATVVVASEGYPAQPRKGQPLLIRALPPGVEAFHAGTAWSGGRLTVSGGRVLGLSAHASTLAEARSLAYAATRCVDGEALFARPDIGA